MTLYRHRQLYRYIHPVEVQFKAHISILQLIICGMFICHAEDGWNLLVTDKRTGSYPGRKFVTDRYFGLYPSRLNRTQKSNMNTSYAC